MKKSIFRWGLVLCMLVGLMTIGASAAEGPACPEDGHAGAEGWTEIGSLEALVANCGESSSYYQLKAGNYYFTANVSIDRPLRAMEGDVTVCLNGCTITTTHESGNYAFLRVGSCDFTLSDCQGTGSIECGNVYTGSYGAYVSNGNLHLRGGTIKGFTGAKYAVIAADAASAIYMSGGTLTNMGTDSVVRLHKADAKFEMTGGTISDNAVVAVSVADGATFNMSGGSIVRNTAASGAGVSTAGIFNMSGGTIGGTAANANKATGYTYGGGVWVTGGTVTITGGTIKNNMGSAASTGKAGVDMFIKSGTVTQSAGTNGRVRNSGGTLSISGGTITDVYVTDGTTALSGGKYINWRSGIEGYFATDSIYSHVDNTIVKGFVPFGEGGMMDFGSSLDLTLYYAYPTKVFGADWDAATQLSNLAANGAAVSVNETLGCLEVAYSVPAASQMHKDITIDFTYGGEAVATAKTSVYELASAWYASAEGDDDLQTLLANMVAYGNAAATAFETGYTVESELVAVTDPTDWSHSEGYGASNADIAAATLSLKDKVVLNIYINGEATDITVDDVAATATVEGGISCVTIDKAMSAAKTPITLAFTVDGTEYTVVYSIADYVIDALEGEQAALIGALQKYIESVCAVCAEA